MNLFRGIIALVVFIAGIILIAMMLSEGFNWMYLAGGFGCFIVAYFSWPSKKRGQLNGDDLVFDILELIIELPVELFRWLFRLLGRMLRSNDGGIDIDF